METKKQLKDQIKKMTNSLNIANHKITHIHTKHNYMKKINMFMLVGVIIGIIVSTVCIVSVYKVGFNDGTSNALTGDKTSLCIVENKN